MVYATRFADYGLCALELEVVEHPRRSTAEEIRQTEKAIEHARQHWSWAQTEADEEYFWTELQQAQERKSDLLFKTNRTLEEGTPVTLRSRAL
jgi:hypothetical protein